MTPLVQEATKLQVSWRLGEYSGEISLYACFIYLLFPVILFIQKKRVPVQMMFWSESVPFCLKNLDRKVM